MERRKLSVLAALNSCFKDSRPSHSMVRMDHFSGLDIAGQRKREGCILRRRLYNSAVEVFCEQKVISVILRLLMIAVRVIWRIFPHCSSHFSVIGHTRFPRPTCPLQAVVLLQRPNCLLVLTVHVQVFGRLVCFDSKSTDNASLVMASGHSHRCSCYVQWLLLESDVIPKWYYACTQQ